MIRPVDKAELMRMNLELGSHEDVNLSLFEKLLLYSDRGMSSVWDRGREYYCSECGGGDMYFFKRVFELKGAAWDPERRPVQFCTLVPLESLPKIGVDIEIPDHLFFLRGQCRECGHEQQITEKPDTVACEHEAPAISLFGGNNQRYY